MTTDPPPPIRKRDGLSCSVSKKLGEETAHTLVLFFSPALTIAGIGFVLVQT